MGVGTTANLQSLQFNTMKTALVNIKNRVNQDLVLLLTEENIAIDIKITSWSSGGNNNVSNGSFTYERSTNQNAVPDFVVPDLTATTVWTGSKLNFTKGANQTPTGANVDQITDLVALSRGENGGLLFNTISETSTDQNLSPAGTLWAEGTTDNLQTLEFKPFKQAFPESVKEIVGKDIVLLLVEENIAIDIKFSAWSNGQENGLSDGSFAYQRSTNPEDVVVVVPDLSATTIWSGEKITLAKQQILPLLTPLIKIISRKT